MSTLFFILFIMYDSYISYINVSKEKPNLNKGLLVFLIFLLLACSLLFLSLIIFIFIDANIFKNTIFSYFLIITLSHILNYVKVYKTKERKKDFIKDFSSFLKRNNL